MIVIIFHVLHALIRCPEIVPFEYYVNDNDMLFSWVVVLQETQVEDSLVFWFGDYFGGCCGVFVY